MARAVSAGDLGISEAEDLGDSESDEPFDAAGDAGSLESLGGSSRVFFASAAVASAFSTSAATPLCFGNARFTTA